MTRPTAALAAVGALTRLQVAVTRFVLRPRRGSRTGGILVVRLDETIGDTVMFSAFLRELREAARDARITLVVNNARRDMYEHCPHVDRIVTTDLGTAASSTLLFRPLVEAWFSVRRHLMGRFDTAFVPRVDYDHHAAFLAYASRAPIRVGFSERSTERKRVVNRAIDDLLTDVRDARPHTHEIDRQLSLLDVLGHSARSDQPEIWIGEDDRARVDSIVTEHGLDDFVVLAPTAGHSDLKQWPMTRYSSVARELLGRGQQVVVIGSPADAELFSALETDVASRAVDLVGKLSVMQSAALIERAAAFVGADSGMTHVAAALGVSTAAVFGPTCVHTFSPRGPLSTVLRIDLACGPCAQDMPIDRCAVCIFDHPLCMSAVQPETAIAVLSPPRRDVRQ